VDVAENFPNECRYVLELLGQVYLHDAEARERGLTPEARLRSHQDRSRPVMDKLHAWLEAQLAERRTEPNSGLGQAIGYLLRHWKPLTLFLRQAGAPLDNNPCNAARGIGDVMPTAGLCRIRHSERMICGEPVVIMGSAVGIITGSPGRRGAGLGA
jgi:hypothetical protein